MADFLGFLRCEDAVAQSATGQQRRRLSAWQEPDVRRAVRTLVTPLI